MTTRRRFLASLSAAALAPAAIGRALTAPPSVTDYATILTYSCITGAQLQRYQRYLLTNERIVYLWARQTGKTQWRMAYMAAQRARAA